MSLNTVALTSAEAWKRRMHPIPFHLDKSGTAMVADKFPEDGIYLALKRPPRGSLVFLATGYQSETHDDRTLVDIVKSTFGGAKYKPLRLGKRRRLELDSVTRVAGEFTTGRGISRKKWLGALVPSPDGGPYGLLATFGIYVGASKQANSIDVMKDPVLKHLSRSFHLGSPQI
jgi:hypothetical protein